MKGDNAQQDEKIFNTKSADNYGWKEAWEFREFVDMSREKERPVKMKVVAILNAISSRIGTAWDGNCGWVQIGWQTVNVDRAQMRPAVGFETSAPSNVRRRTSSTEKLKTSATT